MNTYPKANTLAEWKRVCPPRGARQTERHGCATKQHCLQPLGLVRPAHLSLSAERESSFLRGARTHTHAQTYRAVTTSPSPLTLPEITWPAVAVCVAASARGQRDTIHNPWHGGLRPSSWILSQWVELNWSHKSSILFSIFETYSHSLFSHQKFAAEGGRGTKKEWNIFLVAALWTRQE